MTKEYITGTELGEKLLESVRQMKAGRFGRVTVVETPNALACDARRKTGLSQSKFARLLGISLRTLQDWEQGRREPSGAARTLLLIARERPDAVLAVAT
ncbi:MAG: helix-turn-helix domain-containing protein [Azoarcus sp.]|jgi:putative transcriptional regulator|nr:helix-turn-helix domain-containing protein [Azoarcus sp.]